MISVNNVSVFFGGFTLFEGVSFQVNLRDRIGLAGKNGAGKSTMLKLLSGLQNPSSGEISKPSAFVIGYLPQDMVHQHGRSVMEEALTAFEEITSVEKRIEAINKEFETRTDYESDAYMNLINELTDLNARLDILGVSNREEETEKVLKGLGFERKDFNRQTSEFSGGWRMRIELGKLLLRKPDLLLLDEPTNHLDIESIQWLEEFMDTFPGAVVLISHDRTFLDNVTKRTIEISNRKIYDYKTNYTHYLTLREERRTQQESAAKNQQKYIEHTEALIDKFRAKANKASMAQSLIKKLDKIERVEVDEADTVTMRFKFPPPAHSGKIVLTVEDAGKKYGDKRIFSGARFILEKGDRIAFVGRNGEGKSTMMKMIAGHTGFDGEIKLGHSVMLGYFEQDQAERLDREKTVFSTIDDLAVGDIRKQVRGLLGSFLFSGEDIDKKVKVLSGGERGRLALCKLLLEPYNFLMLDEPTNHLDIRSKEVLKSALLDYEGTFIVVSHDRDFLKGLVNKVYEFRDGSVREHIGGIEEYLEKRKIERLAELNNNPFTKTKAENAAQEKKEPKPENNNEKDAKLLRNKVQKLENEIEELEQKISEMDTTLADTEKYQLALSKNPNVFTDYEKLKNTLDVKMKEWEDLNSRLS
jgi:ATP-binding cassette subfamily F protein 3